VSLSISAHHTCSIIAIIAQTKRPVTFVEVLDICHVRCVLHVLCLAAAPVFMCACGSLSVITYCGQSPLPMKARFRQWYTECNVSCGTCQTQICPPWHKVDTCLRRPCRKLLVHCLIKQPQRQGSHALTRPQDICINCGVGHRTRCDPCGMLMQRRPQAPSRRPPAIEQVQLKTAIVLTQSLRLLCALPAIKPSSGCFSNFVPVKTCWHQHFICTSNLGSVDR